MHIYEPVWLVLLFDELKNIPTIFGYIFVDIHFYFAEIIFFFCNTENRKAHFRSVALSTGCSLALTFQK